MMTQGNLNKFDKDIAKALKSMKNTPDKIKPKRIRRKRGEHRWSEHDGITKCVTCFCDEDDTFVGGQECSYGQKPDWKVE